MSVASNLWYCCLQLCRHNFSIVQVHVGVGSLGFVVLLSQLCGHNFSIVQVHVDVGDLEFVVLLSTIVQAQFFPLCRFKSMSVASDLWYCFL